MEHPTPKAIVSIYNIVCSVDLQCALDLQFLSNLVRNAQYFPSKMNALIIRVRKPTPMTFLVFASGKIIITGAKSELSARLASRHIARYIQHLGHPSVTYNNFTIVAINAVYNSAVSVSLEQFLNVAGKNKAEIVKTPVSAVFKYSPKVSATVFESGKVLVKGDARVTILEAVKSIYPLLLRSRRNHAL